MRQIIICIFTLAVALNAAPLNRRVVVHSLNNTVIPVVGNLQGYTMEETMEVLYSLSGKKINFLYFAHLGPQKSPTVSANQIASPIIDPTTGLPAQPFLPPVPPFGQGPLGQVPVLPLPLPRAVEKEPEVAAWTGDLKNLTLKQVLDVVVMSMQPPVKYVIMDYGVVFIPRDKDKPFMPTRVFQLNPSVFGGELRNTQPMRQRGR